MSDTRLIEVYRAKHGPQAHMLKSALENADIPALVDGDLLQDVLGEIPAGWSTAPRVMVREQDAAKAREILQKFERTGQTE